MYSLTFLPLLLVAIYVIYLTFRSRSISGLTVFSSSTAIVLLALLLVWPVDAITYSLIGDLSGALTRFYVLVSPIFVAVILLYLLNKMPIPNIRGHASGIVAAFLCSLLVISALLLPLTIATGALTTSPEKFTTVDPSAAWLFNSTPNVGQVLSDQYTQGQYTIVGAKQGINPPTVEHFYTPQLFGSLVDPGNTTGNGGSPSLLTNQYIVINLALYNQQTVAGAWANLEALQPHMGAINSSSNLIRIYDDGNVYTLKGL